MGFHTCPYGPCTKRYSNLSSGDVTIKFDSGRTWEMPDMILHYVADHKWLPPADFIDDVMNRQFAGGERLQTKSATTPTKVGYLSGPFETGEVPENFVEKLESLMRQASESGDRKQYRGM